MNAYTINIHIIHVCIGVVCEMYMFVFVLIKHLYPPYDLWYIVSRIIIGDLRRYEWEKKGGEHTKHTAD